MVWNVTPARSAWPSAGDVANHLEVVVFAGSLEDADVSVPQRLGAGYCSDVYPTTSRSPDLLWRENRNSPFLVTQAGVPASGGLP